MSYSELIGKEVYVYYNLHKHVWSVRDWSTKLVIAHIDRIVLADVEYKVSETGRQRVLREQQKNVHAGIRGTVVEDIEINDGVAITYNPYKYSSFVEVATGQPVSRDELIIMNNRKVYAVR